MRAAIEPPLLMCFLCHANKSVTFLKHVQCRMRLISFECMRLCGVYRMLIIIWSHISTEKQPDNDNKPCQKVKIPSSSSGTSPNAAGIPPTAASRRQRPAAAARTVGVSESSPRGTHEQARIAQKRTLERPGAQGCPKEPRSANIAQG